MTHRLLLASLLPLSFLSFSAAARGAPAPLDWPEPVVQNRPGCYWWWMGSAVDRENITWNLETLRAAGMGGVTIVPIYGVKGYEDRFIPYLSPDWLAMMDHAVREADRLGMWVDMSTGTGWPFGGPTITDADCDASVIYENGTLRQTFSGRNVKRAAPGGEGKAVNPYSPAAIADYLTHFDRAFAATDARLPRAMYHDSFEFAGNWCAELPAEFRQRRGYDLLAHLPALFGEGDPDAVARIKADYRETLSDLHLAYLRTWIDWSAGHGCTTREQAHGAPANLLDLYAATGIPETETFGATRFQIPGIRREDDNVRHQDRPQPLINRMASSAAHVAGRPLAASESCTWIRNHFRTALSQAKPEIDQLFLCGINHIFFHGSCYSPQAAPWPGWLFYASMEYNPRNAIWHDAPFLNAYITRCQSILQSGEPDNDIALYWPVHDIWHSAEGLQQQLTVHDEKWLTESPCGETAAWLVANGYGFDYISDRQLTAGQAAGYDAVVVPPTGHMPLATLQQLLILADGGTPVTFLDRLPADVPGFPLLAERRAELARLCRDREDLVAAAGDLRARLGQTGAAREPMADAGLSFIRRTHDQGHHYFVANMGDRPIDEWIALGVSWRSAVILDPHSARSGLAARRGGREVYLQLQPGETRILRTFRELAVAGPAWPVHHETAHSPIPLDGDWQVTFLDGGPERPAPFTTTTLASWTDRDDPETHRFAGTARYATTFDLPAGDADDWVLDLGDVRESARVYVNGDLAATLYSIPFRAPIGRHLRPGANRLEIDVTNLSANRIRDLDTRGTQWQIFHDINFVTHNYEAYDASKWPLTPSGLLGPVRLLPVALDTL